MFRNSRACQRCVATIFKPAKPQHTRFWRNASSISPALLNRARSLRKEHTKLSGQTSETFDAKVAKRLGELEPIASALQGWEDATSALAELNTMIEDPETDEEIRQLAQEDMGPTSEQLDTLSRELTKSLTPKHPFAHMPALLEIRPGVGGGEANLFAADLLRMYKAYCARKGMGASLLHYQVADGLADANGDPPLAEAILEIDNPGAYDDLRSEAGVHRVQRVPATESSGRTHTSAVNVLVLPSIPTSGNGEETLTMADLSDPNSDYYVSSADVRVDVMRARGAGGQHVNTTDSAVRLTHIPTNTVVTMQDSRSQHKNREKAWSILRSRLAQARREAREEEVQKLRKSVAGAGKTGRGDKVRTYNWGQQRVTDHRSGLSVHNLDNVLDGGEELEKVIESVKIWLNDREIQNLIADEEDAAKNP